MTKIIIVLKELKVDMKKFFLLHGLCLIPSAIVMIADILFPSTINLIIDKGIVRGDTNNIIIYSIAMLLLGVLIIVFGYVENMAYAKFQSTFFAQLKQELSLKLIQGQHANGRKIKGGELYTNLLTDLNNISTLVTTLIPGVLINILTFFGVSGFILYYFRKIGILILFLALIITWGNNYFGKKVGESSYKYRNAIGKETSFLQEILGRLEILDMMGYSAFLVKKYKSLNENTKVYEIKQSRIENLSAAYRLATNTILLMLVIVIGAYFSTNGIMEVGVLFSLTIYVQRLSAPISGLIQGYLEIKRVVPYAEQLRNIIITNNEKTRNIEDIKENLHSIEVVNMRYAYEDGKQIFRKFNFQIRQGEIIGLVGENGCGKSTLVKILMRQCNGYKGEILINGEKNLKYIDKNYFINQIGYLDQENILLNGTLREIINPNNYEISDEKILELIESIGLKKSILENGLDFEIAENGSNLSGGEAQKIGLIHIIIENKNWFFLDEPTSAMDEESEKIVCEFLKKYVKGKTGIIITHRKRILDICTKVLNLGEIGGINHRD